MLPFCKESWKNNEPLGVGWCLGSGGKCGTLQVKYPRLSAERVRDELASAEPLGFSIKKSQTTNNTGLYILAAVIYGVAVPYFLLQSLQYEGLGTVNLAWNVLSTLSAYAIGAYFFGEKVTHLRALGIMVALTGLGMVIIGGAQGGENGSPAQGQDK